MSIIPRDLTVLDPPPLPVASNLVRACCSARHTHPYHDSRSHPPVDDGISSEADDMALGAVPSQRQPSRARIERSDVMSHACHMAPNRHHAMDDGVEISPWFVCVRLACLSVSARPCRGSSLQQHRLTGASYSSRQGWLDMCIMLSQPPGRVSLMVSSFRRRHHRPCCCFSCSCSQYRCAQPYSSLIQTTHLFLV
ncbi:hypothetical protein LX32DRAFT_337305 [Colletotrichum zoysiae]|uniref:Uncharacterized protein n=1 Tax=Colletotrichum zoysiae TaxID=1216348 RepID=A0AAD9H253_9PEZI|nr:hypothetical protein LX32DRAFT_337305 [Colletotrichum zoysiae]